MRRLKKNREWIGHNFRIFIKEKLMNIDEQTQIKGWPNWKNGKKMKWSDWLCRLWSSPLDMTDFSILKIRPEYNHIAW